LQTKLDFKKILKNREIKNSLEVLLKTFNEVGVENFEKVSFE
jgi:hypothetical protein